MGNKKIRRNHYRFRLSDKLSWIKKLVKPSGIIGIHVLAIILISYGLIFCYDFITQTKYFQATAIYVTGLQYLNRQDVLNCARIHDTINILAVNIRMSEQLLRTNPWIKKVQIHRIFPSNLLIEIQEHSPIAILDMGRKFLMNEEGEIFKEWDSNDPINFPLITGLDYTDIKTPTEAWSQAYQSVLDILELGKRPDCFLPNKKINKIHIDKDIGITVYPSEGIRSIKLGFHDFSEKYEQLSYILSNLHQVVPSTTAVNTVVEIESIDLHNLNRIVITPVQSEVIAGQYKEV